MGHSIACLLAAVVASAVIATPVESFAQDADRATGAPSARSESTRVTAPADAPSSTPDPAGPPRDDDWAFRWIGLPPTRKVPRRAFEFLPEQRPTSVREYDVLRRALQAGKDDARRMGDDDEVRAYGRELDVLDEWIDEDTALRSGAATAGGVVLISLGGASAMLGVGALAAGSDPGGLAILGGGLLLGGAGLLAVGIPLTGWGSATVMNDTRPAASRGAAKTGRLLLVPGGARAEGTF